MEQSGEPEPANAQEDREKYMRTPSPRKKKKDGTRRMDGHIEERRAKVATVPMEVRIDTPERPTELPTEIRIDTPPHGEGEAQKNKLKSMAELC